MKHLKTYGFLLTLLLGGCDPLVEELPDATDDEDSEPLEPSEPPESSDPRGGDLVVVRAIVDFVRGSLRSRSEEISSTAQIRSSVVEPASVAGPASIGRSTKIEEVPAVAEAMAKVRMVDTVRESDAAKEALPEAVAVIESRPTVPEKAPVADETTASPGVETLSEPTMTVEEPLVEEKVAEVPVQMVEPQPPACEPGTWQHWREWRKSRDAPVYQAGLGLREPPAMVTYGSTIKDGTVVFPKCPYFVGEVRLPVLMVDWDDFDPSSDPSNENNPASLFPAYSPSDADSLETSLNGADCVSQYFTDVSGGQANLSLDVYGWLRSDAAESSLKPRSDYVSYVEYYRKWQCDKKAVFLDALRDAIVLHGLVPSDYDADRNQMMDGAVLVYEGQGGLCSGANLSWLSGAASPDPALFFSDPLDDLLGIRDPHAAKVDGEDLYLEYFNNIPEQGGHSTCRTWAHELGHLLLGYADTYYRQFNLGSGSWALSSGGFGPDHSWPVHPAAFEKWLFARWIEPIVIPESGIYTLDANEIPDGDSYDGTYLYKIPIGNDPNRFLTIENRWFDTTSRFYQDPNPNTGSKWAKATYVESGLMIMEFNLGVTTFSTHPPQLYRHSPNRAQSENRLVGSSGMAFLPGDRFVLCNGGQCIEVMALDPPGPRVRFEVQISNQAS